MNGVEGKIAEDRTSVALLDEVGRTRREQIVEITVYADSRAVVPQVRVAVRANVRVVIGVASKETEKFIEAVRVRRELRPVAEVPLPKRC